MKESKIFKVDIEVAEKILKIQDFIKEKLGVKVTLQSVINAAAEFYLKKLEKEFCMLTEEEEREVIEEMQNTYPPTEEYFNPDFKPTRRHY